MTYDIHQRLGIRAPQADVHHALTGDPAVGGKLVFTFGSPERQASFEVEEVTDDLVVWRGIGGPDEWIDTRFSFALSQEDGETVLTFANTGWREATAFIGHCSTKWATFFIGLKALLEGGRSNSYPDEIVISSWDH